MKKKLWPVFSRIIEHDKCRESFFQGPQAFLTYTVELTREVSSDLRSCWKHNFWRKKASFPVKKDKWPIFSRIIEHEKTHGTIYKGPWGSLTFTLELIGYFFSDLRGCWKQNFWRKRQPFQWKKELTIFNSYHCLWRTSRNNLQGSTSFSYQCCINYRRLFWGTVRLMKTQIFEKKKQTFQWKKIGVLFSRFIERDKAHETLYKGPEAIFTTAL